MFGLERGKFSCVSDRLSTLEAGKIADVMATLGDPTADIRQTKRVFFMRDEGRRHPLE
jgi:hypothetical protein